MCFFAVGFVSMTEDLRLPVERRGKLGTAESRRMRQAGRIPANLYGLGKEAISVSVCTDLVDQLVATLSSVVDVELDGTVEKAVVREVQWNTFSTVVRHLDLLRVDPNGKATVEVPVEFKGEPLGLKDGGAIRQLAKSLTVSCPDYRIPKSIVVRIGALMIGDSIKASDVALPEHATLASAGDAVLIELYDPRKSSLAEAVAE